jgi:hypothetical protein
VGLPRTGFGWTVADPPLVGVDEWRLCLGFWLRPPSQTAVLGEQHWYVQPGNRGRRSSVRWGGRRATGGGPGKRNRPPALALTGDVIDRAKGNTGRSIDRGSRPDLESPWAMRRLRLAAPPRALRYRTAHANRTSRNGADIGAASNGDIEIGGPTEVTRRKRVW